jgi:hypothetical protein
MFHNTTPNFAHPLPMSAGYQPTRRSMRSRRAQKAKAHSIEGVHDVPQVRILPATPTEKCPIEGCGKDIRSRCKCMLSDMTCIDGHHWHRHGSQIYLTVSDHARGDLPPNVHAPRCPACAIPLETPLRIPDHPLHTSDVQVFSSDEVKSGVCPSCVLPTLSRCKCPLSDMKCANGHHWHRHGDQIYLTASDHARGDLSPTHVPLCPMC